MSGASGARISIEELLEHSGWVDRLARRLLSSRDKSDDLVQQTWLAALESPPKDRRGLAGWFRTLMRRGAARRRADDRTRAEREALGARPGTAASAAELAAQAEGHRLLAGMVLELPDPYRSTLLLRYFGGLSLAQIARRSRTPAAT